MRDGERGGEQLDDLVDCGFLAPGSRIAVVRGPGGLPGLDVHAGAWQALEAAGVRPTWLGGCSAGALVAGLDATASMTSGEFAEILSGLETHDVVKKRWLYKLRAATGSWLGLESICDAAPIEALLGRYLGGLRRLGAGLVITATEMRPSGERTKLFHFATGSLAHLDRAVAASMAVAGVWPYVQIDDAAYSDGWPSEPLPLPRGMTAYDLVIVLRPRRLTPFVGRDSSALSRLMWAVDRMGDALAERRRAYLEEVMPRRHLWIDLNLGEGSSLKFDHALIAAAERHTTHCLAAWAAHHQQWLEAGGGGAGGCGAERPAGRAVTGWSSSWR